MRTFLATALIIFAFGAGALAQTADAPDVPLPRPYPDATADAPTTAADEATATDPDDADAQDPAIPLPMPRPAENAETKADDDETADEAPADEEEPSEPASPPKPPRIYQVACPAVLSGRVEATLLDPITEGVCQAQSPFAVTAVMVGNTRVELSAPATLNCNMATALADWLDVLDGYAEANFNSGLSQLFVGTSYMCRPRNNRAGADYSEHGFANGLDVIGFGLEDGTRAALPENWGSRSPEDKFMNFAHDAACSGFTTTLGPEANALHEDHLHVDMGCHGAGCTYRLCE